MVRRAVVNVLKAIIMQKAIIDYANSNTSLLFASSGGYEHMKQALVDTFLTRWFLLQLI